MFLMNSPGTVFLNHFYNPSLAQPGNTFVEEAYRFLLACIMPESQLGLLTAYRGEKVQEIVKYRLRK
jgi:hypothetical protein